MAVSASGWKIAGSGDSITLEALDGSAATAQMREAQAAIIATFGYTAKTEETLRLTTQFWQRPREWLTGGLLLSAYTSLHAAEASRIQLLDSNQLAALLPAIRQRAGKFLPPDDPRLEALLGLPDPTEPTHQALARVQSKLVQSVAAVHAPPAQAAAAQGQAQAAETDLVPLTGMLGRDQYIASMALGEATHAEDQQQGQVRRFRGVLVGIFLGLLVAVGLLAILGAAHPGYFPLCVHNQAATVCPTGGGKPDKADLAFIMAIGGIGAVLAVVTNLTGLKPTGVRYSLSVLQGLVKIPFGAITAMLGIIILSTQANIGVLATHAGLISTAVVFGYSQQLFTKLIDKRADDILSRAGGN